MNTCKVCGPECDFCFRLNSELNEDRPNVLETNDLPESE